MWTGNGSRDHRSDPGAIGTVRIRRARRALSNPSPATAVKLCQSFRCSLKAARLDCIKCVAFNITMADLIKSIKEEMEVISKAPLTFLFTALVIAAVVYAFEHNAFKESMTRKDELITTLRQQLDAKAEPKSPGSPTPTSQPAPSTPTAPAGQSHRVSTRRTGDAATSGDQSPATTGDHNTVNFGNSPRN